MMAATQSKARELDTRVAQGAVWRDDSYARAATQFYRFGSDTIFLRVLAIVTATYVFEGPLRWALNMVGLEVLVYLRDLAQAVLVGLVVTSWLAGQASAGPFVAVLFVLSIHFLIGSLQLASAFQAGLGLKTFLSLLTGFAVAPLLATRAASLTKAATLLFWATVLGVFGNAFFDFPWIGLAYETALGNAEAAKQWTDGVNVRLPGFSRASFSAAIILLVTSVPMLSAPTKRWRKALIVSVAMITIVLTTTKGALTGVAALLLVSALTLGMSTALLSNAFLACLALTCLLLPLIAVQSGAWKGDGPTYLSSFKERIEDMWPKAFDLLDSPGKVIWGRGLGGIGTAQVQTSDWLLTNAADNLFVYLLVAFGCLGVVYCCILTLAVFRYLNEQPLHGHLAQSVRGWTAIWFAYGMTTNMVEDAAMNTAIGIAFGLAFARADAGRLRLDGLQTR